MNSSIITLAAIVMLALLFMKVPVFISVLGGSVTYFILNPNISTQIFA